MIYNLRKTQQLNCDIAEAWTFFSSPHNLARITPKDMGFTVRTDLPEGGIYEGMIIEYTVSPIWSIPLNWKTKIVQVDYQKSFTDFQQKGPYKLWKHHHEFIPNSQGVLMIDTLEYELPFGIIGKVAHSLLVKKKLTKIFSYRYGMLAKLFNKKEGIA